MPDGRDTRSSYKKMGDSTNSVFYPEWYLQHGLRVSDLLIAIDKGKASEIAKQIFQNNKNVVFVSGRVNIIANVVAQVYFVDSIMLRDTIESIKAIPFVNRVEFSEVVEVVGRRPDNQIEEDTRKLLNSSWR